MPTGERVAEIILAHRVLAGGPRTSSPEYSATSLRRWRRHPAERVSGPARAGILRVLVLTGPLLISLPLPDSLLALGLRAPLMFLLWPHAEELVMLTGV